MSGLGGFEGAYLKPLSPVLDGDSQFLICHIERQDRVLCAGMLCDIE